jgi:hypothetical protein
MIETISRGLLDTPHSRGMTVLCVATSYELLCFARDDSRDMVTLSDQDWF